MRSTRVWSTRAAGSAWPLPTTTPLPAYSKASITSGGWSAAAPKPSTRRSKPRRRASPGRRGAGNTSATRRSHAQAEVDAAVRRTGLVADRSGAGEGDDVEPLGGGEDQARLRRGCDQAVRGGESRRQDRGLLVREDRALRRAEDRAPRRHRAGFLLCRARPIRIHGERPLARPLLAQLGGDRAVGEGSLVVQGQALRRAARGVDGRGLLQPENARRARRHGAGEPAARLAGVPRRREEGAGEEQIGRASCRERVEI